MSSTQRPKDDLKSVPKMKTNSKNDSSSPKLKTKTEEELPANKLEELNLNDCAVELRNLKFTYNKSNGYLLDGFTMTFPRSAIYGFLGPSGCGKTTIIKIITGLLTPTSGTVLVNGKSPRHPQNQIPGPGIGYMSQEICLSEAFTIKETFIYFGLIYGLSKEYIKTRTEFLMTFLDLPDQNQLVANLSGGQQRRASLGVAIIHKPPLLIMDEPTVGVDPMLRERIWKHLLQLSAEEKTSIMVTTHYIDECRRAHVVGLMRNGKLLAENSPNTLVRHLKAINLEDVFLKLCRAEEKKITAIELPPDLSKLRTTDHKKESKDTKSSVDIHCKTTASKKFFSLIYKNSITIWRTKLTLLIEILIPVATITLFAISIGNKPYDLKVALNSEERRNTSVNENQKLSELFLKNINNKTIILNEYNSNKSAVDSVINGDTFGALYVNKNFTSALMERKEKNVFTRNETIDASTIYFYGDLTDLNIFFTILRTFMDAMFTFMEQMMDKMSSNITNSSLKPNPKVLSPIIELSQPIYGNKDPLFNEFLLPGIMVTGLFILSAATTGLSLIEERRKGLLERTIVAGAQMHLILIAMISVHLVIAVFQIISCIVSVYLVFSFHNDGSYLIIGTLLLFQTMAGMSLGLCISCLAESPKMAVIIVVGTIIPFLLISGIIWPLEGMEYSILQYISYMLPQTVPIKVIRAVTHKGWSIDRFFVWLGYVIPFVWSIIFVVLSVIFSKFRKD